MWESTDKLKTSVVTNENGSATFEKSMEKRTISAINSFFTILAKYNLIDTYIL